MSKPASILKKQQQQQQQQRQQQNKANEDRFNESVADWHQPYDLDLLPIKPIYSPLGTPPRLRTYVIDLNTQILARYKFPVI
jgi:hypothetical protein